MCCRKYNPQGLHHAIRLPGQHHDRETGLYYNRHRYYDPVVGSYINQDPIGLMGGLNIYSYTGGEPINRIDTLGLSFFASLPSLPQGVVDFSAGMGDGILSTMSFGLLKGQSLRDSLGVDGGIDKCTGAYKSGVVTGAAATLATNAVGAIPKTLTHFTTEAGAAGIAQSGIKSSSAGLFGAGKYASSVGGYPRNPFVPPSSAIPVAINKTTGYVRAVPGTFVQPTTGGATQLVAMNAGYGAVANQNNFTCQCK